MNGTGAVGNKKRMGSRQGYGASHAQPAKKSTLVLREYDFTIFLVTIMLAGFGLAMIFSSSYYTALVRSNNMFGLFRNQAICAVIGLAGMLVAARVDFEVVSMLSWPIYLVSCVLLVYVKFFGKIVNGAQRWIEIGGFTLQPSELAKVGVILMMAVYLAKEKNRINTWKGFIGACMIPLLPMALVMWGKNLSTMIIIGAISFVMIFVASAYFWPFVIGLGSVGAAGFAALEFGSGFRSERLDAWRNPFAYPDTTGYQTIQSLYAVASGGFFGLGFMKSNQKLIYMPEPHNDFIFAVICEELGFFGGAAVLAMFGILVWRGAMTAIHCPNTLGLYIAAGITTLIGVQVIINVAVVTNTIPNTGIPLPFISQGGTSIMVMMCLMGVLLNISKRR